MKKRIILITAASAIIITALGIFYLYRISTRNAVEKLMAEKKLINILIAGSNVYNGNKHKFFCILSLNPDNNNIGITFIPPAFKISLDSKGTKGAQIKDMYIDNFDKISDSLQRDLKINVQFYVELYSPDVEKIVNLIEGVDILQLDQPPVSTGPALQANYLDGIKTMRYINSSVDNSIYVKFDRILDVISTVYYNKGSLRKYKNLQFITEMFKNIKTNLLPQELYSLGDIIFKEGNIYSTMVPGGFQGEYFLIDEIGYKIYENDFLTPFILNKSNDQAIKIKVLNGTSTQGLARKMRNILIRDGLNVVEFGTSPYPVTPHSMIICRKGDFASLKKIAEISGINRIYYVIDSTQMHNILIIIGEDMVK